MEHHTYKYVDTDGAARALAGAVRTGARLPIQIDDQVVIAGSGPLADHPPRVPDADQPVGAGLISRPTGYRFLVHDSPFLLGEDRDPDLMSSPSTTSRMKGRDLFQLI
jgi:hypothetical protein